MSVIPGLFIFIFFGLMGFLYYRFCKRTSSEIFNIFVNLRKGGEI